MLKGNVQLKLTHETIVAAVQMYLDATFAAGKAPTVTAVNVDSYEVGKFLITASGEELKPHAMKEGE